MKSRTQVAQYAATMAKELRKMCHEADLNDLAYLFEVAALEASQIRATNGAAHTHPSSPHQAAYEAVAPE